MTYFQNLTRQEFDRQKNTLNLIASENYPSPKVLQLLGSVWNNKYAEGYPGKRYYAGQVYADELEQKVQDLALQIFDKQGLFGVNVQVLSGSPANSAVYFGFLRPGDVILSLSLSSGGHLSHLHATSPFLKFFQNVNYQVKPEDGEYKIDFQDFQQKLDQYKPKLVIVGFSSYPKQYTFGPFCDLAHQHGALVLADIAHIAGLVAAGLHDSPFFDHDSKNNNLAKIADFVSTTTHKTLRGPRSALLFARKEFMDQLNKTIFPGISGGPHLNQIAATGQALSEILGEDCYPDQIDFKTYSQKVLTNAKALEQGLLEAGLEMSSRTENHLCLVRLPEGVDSLELQQKLEKIGLITNRNVLPFDPKSAWRPSGLRLGTAALTSRGLNQNQSRNLGLVLGRYILNSESTRLQSYATELLAELKWYY
jgi:glycine hydroxymethyltransferase